MNNFRGGMTRPFQFGGTPGRANPSRPRVTFAPQVFARQSSPPPRVNQNHTGEGTRGPRVAVSELLEDQWETDSNKSANEWAKTWAGEDEDAWEDHDANQSINLIQNLDEEVYPVVTDVAMANIRPATPLFEDISPNASPLKPMEAITPTRLQLARNPLTASPAWRQFDLDMD